MTTSMVARDGDVFCTSLDVDLKIEWAISNFSLFIPVGTTKSLSYKCDCGSNILNNEGSIGLCFAAL